MNKNKNKSSWNHPDGYWQVTTEADCEGRSHRTIGFFKGNYADIAFALADKCGYSLHFTRIWDEDIIAKCENNIEKVSITFNDGLLTDRRHIARDVQKVLGDSFVVTNEGCGQIQLYKPDAMEIVRANALEKISQLIVPKYYLQLNF